MAGKADFTEEEWEQLRKGATGAGLLVSVSDRSFLDSLKEASSFAKFLLGSRESESQLGRELASEHGTGFGAVVAVVAIGIVLLAVFGGGGGSGGGY
jgi:hypothetical protein